MKKEISGVYRIISVILSVLLVIQLSTVITLADAPEAEEQPEEVQFTPDSGKNHQMNNGIFYLILQDR